MLTLGPVNGTVSHELHRQRRTAINGVFSKSATVSAVPLILEKTELLCDNLEAEIRKEGTAELSCNFLALTTDLVSAYSFDYSLYLLKNKEQAESGRRQQER